MRVLGVGIHGMLQLWQKNPCPKAPDFHLLVCMGPTVSLPSQNRAWDSVNRPQGGTTSGSRACHCCPHLVCLSLHTPPRPPPWAHPGDYRWDPVGHGSRTWGCSLHSLSRWPRALGSSALITVIHHLVKASGQPVTGCGEREHPG